MTLLRHLVAALIVGAVIWALSVQLSAFRDFQMAEIAVYVVAIAGLSLLIGLSGQISLGHGALMAVLLIRPSGLFSVTHERRV